MNVFIQNSVKELKKQLGKQKRVLEIGSWNFNGGVRQYFRDVDEYIGIDIHKGRGVDLVMSSYDIPRHFKKESFDCILCLETLEHDPYFEYTVQLMHDYLKKGGWLIISTPGLAQGLHEAPCDYYRFMPDVYTNLFFLGYEHFTLAVAFKTGELPKNKEAKIDWTKIVTLFAYAQKPK